MFQQHSYKRRRKQTHTNLQTVFEAVQGGLIAAVSVLLPPLAEQQSSLVQKQVPLHRLEASQLLHAGGTPFMADPHAEGSLHQDAAQLANVTLQSGQRNDSYSYSLFEFIRLIRQLCMNWTQSDLKDLISCDGDLMHGVIDGFEQVQHCC